MPLARYVLENAGHLEFPFRRYQIQKAWRGERPQEGRFREFTQADIDVIGRDTLAVPRRGRDRPGDGRGAARLPLPPVRMQVNNRKLDRGLLPRGWVGDEQIAGVMRVVDKLDKVGEAAVLRMLVDEVALSEEQAKACLALDHGELGGRRPRRAGPRPRRQHPLLDEGLDELLRVLDGTASLASERLTVVADLRMARGLDYYTGTVFETRMAGFEHLGSICSGGRYDALASDGRTTYPGVGHLARRHPHARAAAVPRAAHRDPQHADLRAGGGARRGRVGAPRARSRPACGRGACPTEVAPEAQKYGKQIRYAERRGIPYVWFPQDDGAHEVRDIRSGEQRDADPAASGPTGGGPAPGRDRHRRHRQLTFPARNRHDDRGALVIRTHEAGTLRGAQAGRPSRSPAGSPAAATTAASPSSTCATRRGSCRSSSATRRSPPGCATSSACASWARSSARPGGNANPNLPTGEVEVVASAVEVLSEAAPLPFQIDEHVEVGEEVRLRYRYLDLRRAGPAAALRLRSEVNRAAREVLHGHDFVEIETPTLTRSTPEGARDFLVPARLQPGSWYALPQSPQLFKQLLMVAGMERYFQIARCYRDEDFRADRQPEFTQLDIEMSFVDQDDVIDVAETVVAALWRLIGHELPPPLPRMTYAEAMRRYGSDKPDLRFGQELVELHGVLRRDAVPGVPGAVRRRRGDARRCVPVAQGARRLAGLGEGARRARAGVRPGRRGRRARRPGGEEPVRGRAGRSAGARRRCPRGRRVLRGGRDHAVAGAARRGPAGDRPPRRADRRGPAGRSSGSSTRRCSSRRRRPGAGDVAVGAGAGRPCTTRSPSPKPEWIDRFEESPGDALAYAYDMVCNGAEIGGGSIRIHRGEVQERVFDVMGLTQEQAQEKFGFLLEAFALRRPAARRHRVRLGPDLPAARRTDSIREVIAFPKSGGGFDPLTAAPAPITPEQRKEAGVDAVPEPKG